MTVSRREMIAMTAAATAAAPGIAAVQGGAPGGPSRGAGFHRWAVGDIAVTAVHAGTTARGYEGLVRNASLEEVRAAGQRAALGQGGFENSYTSLVVQTGGRTILLDTAFGDNGPPPTAVWMQNFRAAGFDPARVDQVVVSHFHGDHIGGIRMRDGALQFPNAEISVPEPEWAFWMSDERMNAAAESARGGFQNARRVFAPLAGQVKRFAPGAEVAPGVTSVPAYGHTPGHAAFVVSSGNARLLTVVDAVNHPAFFVRHPDWQPVFDMDPPAAVATRRRLLDMAATEGLQVAFYHAPFPAVGQIARDGQGFEFTPVRQS
jgi:glyoxylase-like metal-dependent hydrolase (beta-lactamase superfamily II)